jgi:hypothetical protein
MPVFPDPPEYTILKLHIPDEDLNSADLAYYAEDEEVDDDWEDGVSAGSRGTVGGAFEMS